MWTGAHQRTANPASWAPSLLLGVMVLTTTTTNVASARTWKSRQGGYSLDAEYVETKDGAVSLRKANGELLDVQVDRLCAKDQSYIAGRAAAKAQANSERPANPAPPRCRTLKQLIESASRLQTASKVHWLFKTFLQDQSVSPADRKAAEEMLPVWEERASKKMVRIGFRWLKPSEAKERTFRGQFRDGSFRQG